MRLWWLSPDIRSPRCTSTVGFVFGAADVGSVDRVLRRRHTDAAMSESYPKRPRLCRPFIITGYVPGPDGRLAAQLPSRCPSGGGRGQPDCCLRIDHYRRRKVGPRHPLTVLRCRTHSCSFTLYPPGYAPYRRQPVIGIAPDGSTIYGEGDRLRTDFDDTLFEAALDAKERRAWARDSDSYHDPPPDKWWATQRRHLALAARLVGVARDLSERVRSSIAAVSRANMMSCGAFSVTSAMP